MNATILTLTSEDGKDTGIPYGIEVCGIELIPAGFNPDRDYEIPFEDSPQEYAHFRAVLASIAGAVSLLPELERDQNIPDSIYPEPE